MEKRHVNLTARHATNISGLAGVSKFPYKLWTIINSCKTGAIDWDFEGHRVVVRRHQFCREYLQAPNPYFKTASFGSFVRQLNLYGFRKLTKPLRKRGWERHIVPEVTAGQSEDDDEDIDVVGDGDDVKRSYTVPAISHRDSGTSPDRSTNPDQTDVFQSNFFVRGRPDMLNRMHRNVGVRRTLSNYHDNKPAHRTLVGVPLYSTHIQHGGHPAGYDAALARSGQAKNLQPITMDTHWISNSEVMATTLPTRPGVLAPINGQYIVGSHPPARPLVGAGETASVHRRAVAQSDKVPVIHIPQNGSTVVVKEDFDKLVTAISNQIAKHPGTLEGLLAKQVAVESGFPRSERWPPHAVCPVNPYISPHQPFTPIQPFFQYATPPQNMAFLRGTLPKQTSMQQGDVSLGLNDRINHADVFSTGTNQHPCTSYQWITKTTQ